MVSNLIDNLEFEDSKEKENETKKEEPEDKSSNSQENDSKKDLSKMEDANEDSNLNIDNTNFEALAEKNDSDNLEESVVSVRLFISDDTSLSLVWEENLGSDIFIDIIATKPSRQSSPDISYFSFPLFFWE